MQRVVAEEHKRIFLAPKELLPQALDAIIAAGIIQGRTTMRFGSVRDLPCLPLMAGSMSGYALVTAIAQLNYGHG